MGYFDQLYTASYNGVPFFVKDAEGDYGRRIARHTYPFRDGCYAEDMGKKSPDINISGFLVGDDVAAQRDFMLTVCQMSPPGILIHPTLGIMNVVLADFKVREAFDHGRQIIFDFHFITGSAKLFPSSITSTLDNMLKAVGITNSAAISDFVSSVATPIAAGAQVVTAGVMTAGIFAAVGGAAIKSATNIFSLASSIPGSFGRYAGGNTGSSTGSINGSILSIGGISAQVASLSSLAAGSRANTASAGASMVSTGSGM